MEPDEKARLEKWYDCKCGGQFRFDFEQKGIAHTLPTCEQHDKMDFTALVMSGQLRFYLAGMMKHKASS